MGDEISLNRYTNRFIKNKNKKKVEKNLPFTRKLWKAGMKILKNSITGEYRNRHFD